MYSTNAALVSEISIHLIPELYNSDKIFFLISVFDRFNKSMGILIQLNAFSINSTDLESTNISIEKEDSKGTLLILFSFPKALSIKLIASNIRCGYFPIDLII